MPYGNCFGAIFTKKGTIFQNGSQMALFRFRLFSQCRCLNLGYAILLWRSVNLFYYCEAPIYFSNIFISFLGLAYYTPLGCSLRFFFLGTGLELLLGLKVPFFGCKRGSGPAKLPKKLNLRGHPKGVK